MSRNFVRILPVTVVILLLLVGTALAQNNFTPLKEGEYKTEYEEPKYVPDARISGDYRFIYLNRRGSRFSGGAHPYDYLRQEFNLMFTSEVNTNVSLNVEISNDYSIIGTERDSYVSKRRRDIEDGSKSNDSQIILKQSYVEYNHNPMAMLRFGKQKIELGDREGLVFKGILTGITQQCKVGSWCYSIGAMKLGPNDNDRLYWGSLDYPVYESGVMVNDPWDKKAFRHENSLNVEIHRVYWKQHDIALAKFGGRTWKSNDAYLYNSDVSEEQATIDRNTTPTSNATDDHLAYFDTNMEYYGVNLNWRFYGFKADLIYVQMNGRRIYHVGTDANEDKNPDELVEKLASEKLMGFAVNLNLSLQFAEEWQFTTEGFWTNGNENNKEKNQLPIWERGNLGFHEINHGTFGDANIYFSGDDGSGEGHSVNNLTYGALHISYRDKEKFFYWDASAYAFFRTNFVYNENGDQHRFIGYEFDTSITFIAEKSLFFEFQASYFQTGGAYVRNDNDIPVAHPEDFTFVGAVLKYKF